jgi:hypothetical protein
MTDISYVESGEVYIPATVESLRLLPKPAKPPGEHGAKVRGQAWWSDCTSHFSLRVLNFSKAFHIEERGQGRVRPVGARSHSTNFSLRDTFWRAGMHFNFRCFLG